VKAWIAVRLEQFDAIGLEDNERRGASPHGLSLTVARVPESALEFARKVL
jgi:hypothetical protein